MHDYGIIILSRIVEKVMSKKSLITVSILAALAVTLVIVPFVIYLKVLPDAVSNPKVITYVQKTLAEQSGVDLDIKNPVLKTSLTPKLTFGVEKLSLTTKNSSMLDVKNFETTISFGEIFKQKITVNKLGADYLFADVNKLMELAPKDQKEQQKSDWNINLFDSLLYVKNCLIVYKAAPDMFIKVSGKDMSITSRRQPKFVHFDVAIDIKKGKETIKLALKDDSNVFIKDKKLVIQDCALSVNNSKMLISSVSDQKNNFALKVYSKKFDVANIVELLETNLVVPDGDKMLAFFKDIKGTFDFNINITNNDLNGDIKLHEASLKLVPLNNLPIIAHEGTIKITKNDVFLRNFKGYYGTCKRNQVELNGSVRDYTKSVNTDIVISGVATKEFSKNYLSKIVGYPLEITGDSKTKLIVKSVYSKIDLVWMMKVAKGDDILVDGASLSPVNYDRAVKADFHFEDNLLNIKSIKYFIAKEINKNSKIKPILTIDGNVDFSKEVLVKNLGFEIPKPLPSEFLNVLAGQKIFKKGTIEGRLQMLNTGKYPTLDGNLAMKGVRVPSQRLSIKEGDFYTDNNSIMINAFGKYKRSNYKMTGNFANQLTLPIVVRDINLSLDSLDIEKLMNSFNSQPQIAIADDTRPKDALVGANPQNSNEENENSDDDNYTFNTGYLIIEKCVFELAKGVYKEIGFGNVKATLTLNKEGILEVNSNRFDFAEGISSCKVHCDLKKHLYSVRLGVKDVNSDLIATTLLALKKEISGKASGLILLNTDDSLKMNGSMKFIVKDGTIGKIGLVEYVMKFASLFRNPAAMISPSTIVDLVNIPEGNFEKIVGDLRIKDNIVERLMIKSTSPQLSSFIIGRYDIERSDATLRIYTKFSNSNKGFAGFLRNISLNSLANRVPLNSRNDSNFYSAELAELPPIDADEKDCQVFLTKVDGDVAANNFISSLKRIK